VLHRIESLLGSGALKTAQEVSVCPRCYGTGYEVGERGARKCECRRPAIVSARLAKIPPRYRGVTLADLSARTDLHPGQAAAVEYVKANPDASYVLCGRRGTGKTHLFWALYQHAAQNLDRRIVACSMLQLIEQYRAAFRPRTDPNEPAPEVDVRPNDLLTPGARWSLFFDDIDKPKISEYVAEQTHALFDAAYNNMHQIVVTTNLNPDDLEAHFARADERFGGPIVRRIVHDGNDGFEFF
jgi:DNA replication protein DnaC